MIPTPDLVLYARPGCHLCEDALEAVRMVMKERAEQGLTVPALVERNIEDDEALHRAMLERIPVVEIGGRRIELVVGVAKVRRLLAESLDASQPAPPPTSGGTSAS